MSIFHLSVKAVSRATGRSSVAAAAYRAGERLLNERDGRLHDFTNKPVVEAFIVVPVGAPPWARDRGRLWNAVEVQERRKDAKLAREYEIALPAQVGIEQRRALVCAFAHHLVQRYGVAVDVAIHPPNAEGDERNHHAHLLTTTRSITADGWGPKTRLLDVSSSASVEVEGLREHWAGLVNEALASAKVTSRVDHRSFERQGRAEEPTVKLGPAVTAIERRAARLTPGRARSVTERGRRNALLREIRGLQIYLDRGRAFLARQNRRLVLLGASVAAEIGRRRELSRKSIEREGLGRGRGR
jgi:ATP-dependent exoDNAse (exonuclease V) alpha subunit